MIAMRFDPDDLHELTGVPDPPPATRATPLRWLGGSGTGSAPEQHDPRTRKVALGLLLPSVVYLLARFEDVPGRWWVKLLVVGGLAGGIAAVRRWGPRLQAAHYARVQERSRQALVRQRWRHVPDSAISPARPRPDDALDRGISRTP